MLVLNNQTRVLIATSPTDMRKSFDALACLVRDVIREDPLSGYIFVFLNRNRDCAKLLQWESNGFWIHYKRLERGTFRLPVSNKVTNCLEVDTTELSLILEGIDLNQSTQRVKFIRQI